MSPTHALQWVDSTIGEVVLSKVEQGAPDQDKDFTYIDIGSIDSDTKTIASPKRLAGVEAPSRARQRLKSGDVLVSMTRPNLNAVALVPPDLDGSIGSTGFCVLRAEKVDSRWLYFLVRTSAFVDSMSMLVQGALYPAVRMRDVHGFPIKVPPLDEQKQIVAEIETQFARLDDAVAALKRAQARLKRYRASVLKAACEGRLVPTEAELARQEGRDYEPASVLLDRIKAERAANPGKKRGKAKDIAPPDTSSLPKLPVGWVWASLGMAISDGPQNGLYKPASEYGTGVAIVRIDDFQDFFVRSKSELRRLRISEQELQAYELMPEDLIINRVNSAPQLGKCLVVTESLIPAVFESNMMRMRLNRLIITKLAAIYLRSVSGRELLIKNAKWAVNQASINQNDVATTPLPIPPLAEQERIVAEVDRLLSVVDQQEAIIATNLKRAESLRQSILRLAFSGKLVTPPVPKGL